MISASELSQLKKYASKVDEKMVRLFDALGDINRYKIFNLLLEKRGDICVSEFAEILKISVPAASQQLKSLELSGLIKRVRNGQSICYQAKATDPRVKSLITSIKS
ncbi:MAG: metalloregulator ArsR/SmtB family transcription factor [Patescibacteria group bacterium]|nr:metalloregulator ArsR/SmtB family transcription factor [Patescibacteria group bacterium]